MPPKDRTVDRHTWGISYKFVSTKSLNHMVLGGGVPSNLYLSTSRHSGEFAWTPRPISSLRRLLLGFKAPELSDIRHLPSRDGDPDIQWIGLRENL